jgi:hypothetical protein
MENKTQDITERVLSKIRKRIEKPNFKSKIEVARLSMKELLKELDKPSIEKLIIETNKINCSVCHQPIEIVLKGFAKKTLRSWTTICMSCQRVERINYEQKIKELETDLKDIKKLNSEGKFFSSQA